MPRSLMHLSTAISFDPPREALGVVPDTSLPAARVVRELKQIGSVRGLPQRIRIDNGPEMLAQVFTNWCEDNGIELAYIQPGKPNQNAYIERFNPPLSGWLEPQLLES